MLKTIYLAGGCFWGTEKYLSLLHGVVETEVGYANGGFEHPSYEQVCAGSGHTEAVRVVYEDSQLTLPFLLDIFYESIDPTSVNRQGGDHGINYRTGIYYTDEADRPAIEASLARLAGRHDRPIAVELLPLADFSSAEDYHQRYLDRFPGGYCHINHTQLNRAERVRDPAIYG
ncbi:MAG: peptide-methionine (S)-S-oxide reductase MsrA [Clostridiales bacterium]|nr:peptide-methionine (S)-S-oxide reductase MsrA [Clostridiales bacterium]